MRQGIHGRTFRQVRRVRREFLQEPDLCLGRLLPRGQVEEALRRHAVVFRDCFYTPLVTLWTFLYQVLGADQSCRAAVVRLLASLGVRGDGWISAGTGPYCKARERIPEALVADLARHSGAQLQARFPGTDLLGGRPIKIADGTTVSMPDTPENQQAYPQQPYQKPGLGYPIIRLVGVMSLSCGVVLDVALGAYSGKKTGETALLRQLFNLFQRGEVALADAMFANYWTLAGLLARGVDVIARRDGKRRLDWRTGQRLGTHDHVVAWPKPPRPSWMSRRIYRRMPETLCLRELAVDVHQPGFRTRRVIVVTTLLDAQVYPPAELAAVYRARWHAELDLRAIKQVMAMDVLRCKSPAMVRKEIWMHLLAYNLIRTLLAQAALAVGVRPRELSFKGALQTLNAFAAVWPLARDLHALYASILQTLATHRVGDRPNRIEPRAVKRRPKTQTFLTEPRHLARNRLLKKS
jgi:hypothetical protein